MIKLWLKLKQEWNRIVLIKTFIHLEIHNMGGFCNIKKNKADFSQLIPSLTLVILALFLKKIMKMGRLIKQNKENGSYLQDLKKKWPTVLNSFILLILIRKFFWLFWRRSWWWENWSKKAKKMSMAPGQRNHERKSFSST